MAEVCSKEYPRAFATGATGAMPKRNPSKSNAALFRLSAITSTTRPISDESIAKALRVAPATSAEAAKSSPVAKAKLSVASVIWLISAGIKPSFAYSS